MRRLSSPFVIFGCLALGLACAAESLKEPAYGSQKPVYAKVALTEDGSRVLSVVFDESKGTGNGYDVLYADVDSNGAFDEPEKVTAKSWKCSPTGLHCDFPAVRLSVAPKSEGLGKTCDCAITFNYAKHTYTTQLTTARAPRGLSLVSRVLTASTQKAAPAVTTTTNESFSASGNIKVGEGSTQWEYSFGNAIKPAEKAAEAPVWNFLEAPKLALTCKPDDRVKGNLGIGFELMAGETTIVGKKGATAINARVEVKKPNGKVVHKDEGPTDKYGFG